MQKPSKMSNIVMDGVIMISLHYILTLIVLGESPLKKPVEPSSFNITLKQSNMPLYFWTLPNDSLAS